MLRPSAATARPDLRSQSSNEIDRLIHERQISPEDVPSFLLELSKQWTQRIMGAGGNLDWKYDGIVATERAMETLASGSPARRERMLALSGVYARWASWNSSLTEDLDEAIYYETRAFETPDPEIDDLIARLQTLSFLHAQRYERRKELSDLHAAIELMAQTEELVSDGHKAIIRAIVQVFRFKEDDTGIVTALEVPFEDIPKSPVSMRHVDKRRFRFVDCRRLVDKQSLRILELQDLPKTKYATISYPWHGLGSFGAESATMTIDGADDADPVSLRVLTIACETALLHHCELLWFDALCIKQDDEEDKAWQIEHMFEIYKHCRKCLILPGGLMRLADIGEPTTWMDRAWTLQEAIAPDDCLVLFAWTLGNVILQTFFPITIDETHAGEAATASLHSLLMMSRREPHILRQEDRQHITYRGKTTLHIGILGNNDTAMMALLGALDHKVKPQTLAQQFTEGKIGNTQPSCREESAEGYANAVWRCAMMKVASRPVDNVFSIMGLLGVALDPREYLVGDRVKATKALMRVVLERGGRAEWLGISPTLPLNDQISTMPAFPSYKALDEFVVETLDGEVDIATLIAKYWKLIDAPKGGVSRNGMFSITAKSASVEHITTESVTVEGEVVLKLLSQQQITKWRVLALGSHSLHHAVFVGVKKQYSSGSIPRYVDPWDHLVMLVKDDGLGSFRNIGYANATKEEISTNAWSERTFDMA